MTMQMRGVSLFGMLLMMTPLLWPVSVNSSETTPTDDRQQVLMHMVKHDCGSCHGLNLTGGLVFSQRVLLALTKAGLRREEAYAVVQENALAAWEQGGESFRERIARDERVTKVIDPEELAGCFDLSYNLRHVDRIFDRVLGDEPAAREVRA